MNAFTFLAAAIPLEAESFLEGMDWLTNSILVSLIVVAIVLFFARKATRNIKLVPDGAQNAFEAILETLYGTLEDIVGPHMIKRVFSMLATLFIYILVANWFGLLPGVGSIGFGERTGPFLSVPDIEIPLFRPATADLNMTLGMAVVFMIFWFWWSVSEVGVWGFLKHMFGVKGGLKGPMALVLLPIFIGVGVIEVVSIAFRPVSLSLRLFGNVFAGENLLTTMLTLGNTLGFPAWVAKISSVLVPIPFYFLEILIGLLQAMVFTLLCAVYIALSTTHDEEEAH